MDGHRPLSTAVTPVRRPLARAVDLGALALLTALPWTALVANESFYAPFVTPKAYLFRLAVQVLVVAWAVLVAIDPRRLPRPSGVLVSVLGLTLIALAADLVADHPSRDLLGELGRMGGFAATAHLAALLVVAVSILDRPERWRPVLASSVAATAAAASLAVLQALGVRPLEHASGRVDGGLGNPAFLAGFLLGGLFAALELLAEARPRRPVAAGLAAAAGLDAGALVLSGTRSALLGLAAGVVVLVAVAPGDPHRRRLVTTGLVVMAIVAGLAVTILPAGLETGFEPLDRFLAISADDTAARSRLVVWRLAAAGAAERPLLGWGEEGFIDLFNRHYDPELWRLDPNVDFDRPHSAPLQWLAAAGVPGLVGYLAVLVCAGLGIARAATPRPVRAVLAGWLAAHVVHTLFVFEDLAAALMLVLLLGVVHTLRPGAGRHETRQPSRATALAAAVAAVALAGLATATTVIAPARAERLLVDGLRAMATDPASGLARLEAAVSASPAVAPHACDSLLAEVSKLVAMPAITAETRQRIAVAAREVVEGYLDRAPGDLRTRLRLARFLDRTGDPDRAVRHLEVARSQSPRRPDVLIELATAELDRRRPEAALEAARAAFELVPDDLQARDALALTAIYGGRRAFAEELLAADRATVLAPDERFVAAHAAVGDFDAVVATVQRVPAGEAALRARIAAAGAREIRAAVRRNPEWSARADEALRRLEELEP